jgi:SSS family solute:Na+ symporter
MSGIFVEGAERLGTWADYLIVVLYFVGILGFGVFFSRYSRSTKDFFFGGQRFSWWLIAASLVATGIGSYSFLKYSQAGFIRGMSSTLTYLNDWFLIPLFMFGWLPIIYFARVKSVPEYFARRFDERTRSVATFLTLLYLLGYVGLNFYLLGIALKALLGIKLVYSVPIVALVCAIYVTAGGQTAVIFTDLVQGFFLYAAGFILLFLGLKYVGGLSGWWEGMDLAHRLPFPDFNRPADFNHVGIFWAEGIVGTFGFTFINQGFIMRYLAAKSVYEGRKCLCFNTLILMPISAVVVGIGGWLAVSMASQHLLPEGVETKEIFVVVANEVLKPGLFGFVIAALTAALMSTVDTLINACTAIGLYDVYKAWIKRDAEERHYLKVARVISVLVTILGVFLVWPFAQSKSIFAAHYAFVGIVTPPMIVAIALGAFWRRFTPQAAFWSMIIGSGFIGLSLLWPDVIRPLAATHDIDPAGGYKYFRALYGLIATGIFAVVLTFFTRPRPAEEIVGLTVWSVQEQQTRFKGGPLNDEPGHKAVVGLEVDPAAGETVSLSRETLERLKARPGDLLYVSDARAYLGGLRSLHIHAGEPHAKGPVAILTDEKREEGNLLPSRRVRVEKIF